MKYLSDYTKEATTELLKDTGAFFAFSNKQFDEQKQEGVTYCRLNSGTICPKANAQKLVEGMKSVFEAGIKRDLAENGKKGIIHRELGNHEYCITLDITDTSGALSGYGITDDEIQAECGEYLDAYYKWEEEQERKEVVA